MAVDIFSEDCICTALCGEVLGTFTFEEITVFKACACGEDISIVE